MNSTYLKFNWFFTKFLVKIINYFDKSEEDSQLKLEILDECCYSITTFIYILPLTQT